MPLVHTLYLSSHKKLPAVTLLADLVLPEGYEQAVITSLAVMCAKVLGKPVTQDMLMLAKAAIDPVQRNNFEIAPQTYETRYFNRRF